MNSKSIRRIAAFVLALAGMAMAQASTVLNVVSVSMGPYERTVLTGGTLGSGTLAVNFTGMIELTLASGDTVYTYCDDLSRYIYLGANSYTFEVYPLSVDNTGVNIATSNPLSTSQIENIGRLVNWGIAHISDLADAEKSPFEAAVQAEVWRQIFGVTATGSAEFAAAYGLLETVLPTLPIGSPIAQLYSFDSNGNLAVQSLVTTNVAEPGGLALAGLALCSLGIVSKRRKVLAT